MKPHVLGEKEERLLALQAESAGVAQDAFSVLTNVDVDFGAVDTPEGPRPLTQSSFQSFMSSPDRELRRRAYFQLYAAYDGHKNTLPPCTRAPSSRTSTARRCGTSPRRRRPRFFPTTWTRASTTAWSARSEKLPVLHEYYELRKAALKLDELRHYDLYVPLAPEAKARHTYAEAVDLVCAALAPLGEEYVAELRAGSRADGSTATKTRASARAPSPRAPYSGEPYILLNYKEDVLHDVFTLAHEGGHSMHSYYSAAANPFHAYGYTIFEAEVARPSTSSCCSARLYDRAEATRRRPRSRSGKLDDTRGTLFRQTMFAEFERRSHEMAEADEPLTVDSLRSDYRELLVQYFGPSMPSRTAERPRVPPHPALLQRLLRLQVRYGHSASIALSERLLGGGATGRSRSREDYFAFLRSGGSRFPIESLKVAGVDMSSPEPIRAACASFSFWCSELKRLLRL